ncbi:N-acetylmuramoyl-L-alanine amidase [Saccharopolyspora flava]|uniref:N-acetylmuramoyl-L-alanine amidase n=1 Tax=Saccharopolyspora flava TaxID=95161 RepID=A0A1I6PP16_9PSEU|nr:peptidoglycan recognition family protein [Saccharopolyspora flava]SFS41934.1 N-acetylmuramoyl-L-alanine amidase [Saccharopolyspora flava]
MRRRLRAWSTAVAAGLLIGTAPATGAPAIGAPAPDAAVQRAFESSAAEFGVPAPILLATSYQLTRWEDHRGRQSRAGGYGPMHLTDVDLAQLREQNPKLRGLADHPALHTLPEAAKLVGASAESVERDPASNIRAGAALLAERAERLGGGTLPSTLGGWYPAIAELSGSPQVSGARDFADSVYEVLGQGRERTTATGQHVGFAPVTGVTPDRDLARTGLADDESDAAAECPESLHCRFLPAAYAPTDPQDPAAGYGNYDTAQRPKDVKIDSIVLHDTEVSYQTALSLFQDPANGASAHYVIRSSDGQITQMVPTEDMAWQAGSWDRNTRSIGIEHEGWANDGGTWYTEAMYRSSAKLVRYLAAEYGIPLDREHILGHDEVSADKPGSAGTEHYDPGPYWDWAHYMSLVGAPLDDGRGAGDAVTIYPRFDTNQPPVTECPDDVCQDLPAQPANFVYLRTEPRDDAPLLSNPALHPGGEPGTTRIEDWSAKAATGRQYAVAERRGDWLAIWFGGEKAWLRDPDGQNTAPALAADLVEPRRDGIPTYGMAAPAPGDYPEGVEPPGIEPLPYVIPAGQAYVAGDDAAARDYYVVYDGLDDPNNHTVVEGDEQYVRISYHHRWVYVKRSDVRPVT